jgi:hypothetical protein
VHLFISLFIAEETPIVVSISIVRIEANSFVVIGDRSLFISLVIADNTPIAVGFSIVRIEANSFVVIGDRTRLSPW